MAGVSFCLKVSADVAEGSGLGSRSGLTPDREKASALYGRPLEGRYQRGAHCGNVCNRGWRELVDVPFLRCHGGHCDLGNQLNRRHQLGQR